MIRGLCLEVIKAESYLNVLLLLGTLESPS